VFGGHFEWEYSWNGTNVRIQLLGRWWWESNVIYLDANHHVTTWAQAELHPTSR